VPILLTPGNHDYRKNHYHLVFDVNEVRTDIVPRQGVGRISLA
jgi:hypothetical protein